MLEAYLNHECSIPLKGWGELAQSATGAEQVSVTHTTVFHPKRKEREVQVVTNVQQLGMGRLQRATNYLQNAKL